MVGQLLDEGLEAEGLDLVGVVPDDREQLHEVGDLLHGVLAQKEDLVDLRVELLRQLVEVLQRLDEVLELGKSSREPGPC